MTNNSKPKAIGRRSEEGRGTKNRLSIFSRDMITRETIVRNKYGLHARPSAKVVGVACRFSSDISVEYNRNRVDGKSIMALELLGVTKDCHINIYAQGEDEQKAMEAIIDIIENVINKVED